MSFISADLRVKDKIKNIFMHCQGQHNQEGEEVW